MKKKMVSMGIAAMVLVLCMTVVGCVSQGNTEEHTPPEEKPVVVTTFAGSTEGYADGTGAAAQFDEPRGVAVDSVGNVYVADYDNNRIRKITPEGVVTTLAGGTKGYADGTGAAAKFNEPTALAVDSAGNVYVTDNGNSRIRKITSEGVVTTFAGSTEGYADGTGTAAKFHWPNGVALDRAGNVYVGDSGNHRIRKITPEGAVTTFAGSTEGYADGTGAAAKFYQLTGVALDSVGNFYVADSRNSRIRKITSEGVVTTLAGSTEGYADGTGAAAKFAFPNGVVVDGTGNVYVADWDNHRIRKITPEGVVTTLAGEFNEFNHPRGVALDSAGNVYVVDQGNHRIYKITITTP
ncbi:hypothetical protein FACS189445_5290 [Spirochaetia bacterium]|nr:hypothetical protein FACS189445_5290 [Spirochaetia bacterium]